MRAVLQRVLRASVSVEGQVRSAIGPGLVVLVGVSKNDVDADADSLAAKVLGLRIFPDPDGKMNRSVVEAKGSLLIVSQFTLYGDCRKGRRPSFDQAAGPDKARRLYVHFVEAARAGGIPVETGIFQARMAVELVNDGPVTILCDTADPPIPVDTGC